ncbi:MAG: type 4a pilus biogenesis protein PilO [Deltaproteobacteria bacterium]|nr:MAG: type 4a pilus biogenesis protein PilO [Deltaproteobacteria bacterium]
MAVDVDAYFDKISKLSMTHRVLIFAATVVVLVGLFIVLIYMPKTDEIAVVESELSTLDKKITDAKFAKRDLQKLEMELAAAQDELTLALRLLPTTSEIPSLLKSITKLGNDSNLEFLLFSPEKEVTKEELYVEIPVSIEVRGGYHDVAMFFDKIGKLDRIVNVVDVSIIPTQPNSTILKTTCKALTYRFKEATKAQGVPEKGK